VARLLAPRLQARWDQPFFVENKPGASGTIGTEVVVKSPPDGHTIMVGPASIVTAPHLYPKISYDVVKDLSAVTNVGSTSLALVVHKSVPVGTVREFIAWVKSQPGKLNYGSPGNGTHHHFCMELLKLQAGLDIVHVPYKGSAPAENDLIAGVIPPCSSRSTLRFRRSRRADQGARREPEGAPSLVSRHSLAARAGRDRL